MLPFPSLKVFSAANVPLSIFGINSPVSDHSNNLIVLYSIGAGPFTGPNVTLGAAVTDVCDPLGGIRNFCECSVGQIKYPAGYVWTAISSDN